MKVKELIEKLKNVDPEMIVASSCYELNASCIIEPAEDIKIFTQADNWVKQSVCYIDADFISII